MKRLLITTCMLVVFASFTQAGEWKLVWSDEFDYMGLPEETKWNYEEGFIRNREMQYYTRAREQNVRVENGVLVIEGLKEAFENPKYKAGSQKWNEQRQVARYTSGSINTLGKAGFRYGRIEVRARMPQGKGMWPAIWMMGTNRTHVGWPRCGEIDIMEYVGKDPHTIHANNHFANPGIKDKAVHKSAGGGKITIQEPYKDFHLYAIEWDEQQIKFFVDDQQYSRLNIDVAGKGPDNPFRKEHYLLLNLALGGSWGGEIDDQALPQRYEIDYVRVFKQKSGQQEESGG
jgi:beta-glucanase (GH16 family)